MEELKNVITYISVAIAPIIGIFIQLSTFLNDRKKKDVEEKIHKEVSQNNNFGNNYYYEDNRTFNVAFDNLQQEQQHVSVKQQNINDICKCVDKYFYWYLVVIYFINVSILIFPFPKLPFFVMEADKNSALDFIFAALLKALQPTTENFLILIGLMCLIMVLKKLLLRKNMGGVILAVLFAVSSGAYFACTDIVSKISLDAACHLLLNNQREMATNLMATVLPWAFLFLLMLCFVIALCLKTFLLETKHTKPRLGLLRISLPRGLYYALIFLSPWFILVMSFSLLYINQNYIS